MKSAAERRGDAFEQLQRLRRATVNNAAPLMGIHPHTLRKKIQGGEVRVLWIGTRPWVPVEEIERWRREGGLKEEFRGSVVEEAKSEYVPEGC